MAKFVSSPSFRKSRRDFTGNCSCISSIHTIHGDNPESKSNNAFLQPVLTGMWRAALIFSVLVSPAYADTCPSPKDIRDREISSRYDWAVGENTTLKELLSVQTLYAVRIMDYDSYVSCRYTTKKWPVILDGTPKPEQCRVLPTGGEWTGTDSGQLVCREKDVTKGLFNLECKKESD